MATYRSLTSAAALLLCATTAVAQAPANDDCSGAIAVTVGSTPYDTTMAPDGTGLALDPAVCTMGIFGDDQIYQDIWFTFTPPASAVYNIACANGGGTSYDSRLAVYDQSTCPDDPALVLYCNDDDNGAFEAAQAGWLDMGDTYTVRVGSYDPATVEAPAFLEITNLGPVPANDTCATAAVAMLGNTAFDSTTASDAGLALDPMVCDFAVDTDDQLYSDVWFTYSPAASGFHDISVVNLAGGDSYDSVIAIYSATTCPDDPALVIACNDEAGISAGEAAVNSIMLTTPNSYMIRVGSFGQNTDEELAELVIALGGPPPSPPANDDCATATVASLGFNAFDTTGATDGSGLALDPMVCDMGLAGDEQIYADAWFTFTPASTGNFNIAAVNNANPSFDSRLAIYSPAGCPDVPANVIACDDDSGVDLEASITLAMFAGQSYLVRMGSYSEFTEEEPGALSISFIGATAPNDDCSTPQAITAFGLYPYDSSLATDDGADLGGACDMGVFGDTQIHHDVWYQYTPTVGGCTYISTLGLAGFDTRIAVYDVLTCPDDPANIIACNDDEILPIADPFESGMDVDLVAGFPYLIRVGTYGGGIGIVAGGPSTLNIDAGPQADVNNSTGTPQVGAPGCVVAPSFPTFCTGDGGDQMGCTDCPCSNNAIVGSGGGCLHSGGTGSRLVASGDPSVSLPAASGDDLRFEMTDGAAFQLYILNSGDALAPGNPANPCFGLGSGAAGAAFDGLRCAITNTLRNGGRGADANGDVGMTNAGWGGADNPPGGIAVFFGYASGSTRYFQNIHRDSTAVNCGTGLNTTQAIEVTFTP